MRRLKRTVFAGLWSALFAVAGCGGPAVVRVVDGREIPGPFISDSAYLQMAKGAEAEARNQLDVALSHYEQAAEEDTESAAVWVELGRLRCVLRHDEASVKEAFEKAETLDAEDAGLWKARAVCSKAQGNKSEALQHADKARSLDPGSDEIGLLHAELLELLGREDEAFAELHELTIRHPASLGGHLALMRLSQKQKKAWAVEAAEGALRSMARGDRVEGLHWVRGEYEALDRFLIEGNMEEAKREGRRMKMEPGDVALRAALFGRAKECRELGELIALSDPANVLAWMAYAVGADLERNESAYQEAIKGLRRVETGGRRPTKLAVMLFTELMERRVGLEGARAYLESAEWRETGSTDEAKGAAVAARVLKKMAKEP